MADAVTPAMSKEGLAQVLRHAYVREHKDTGLRGIHAESSDKDILRYTGEQSAIQKVFPAVPPIVLPRRRLHDGIRRASKKTPREHRASG